MNVDELYQLVKFYINKEKGDFFTPDSYNLLLPRAQDDFFCLEYGLPERYQPGMPVPKISYAVTQKILDDLHILLTPFATYLDANGKLTYPLDYINCSSISSLLRYNGKVPVYVPVEIMDDDKYSRRLSHPYKFPVPDYPICNFYDTYIEFKPDSLASTVVKFTYLRYPKTPFRAFTIVNDNDVYDPTASIQLEMPAITHNKIARILLSYLGIHLRDEMVTAYAEMIKNSGI